MANRSNFNNHNGNIRGQGGWGPWVADVNDEIYQNVDQIETQTGNNQAQISSILNSELPSKQNTLNDHEQRLQNSQNQINQILNSDLVNKQNQINDHESRLQGQQNAINNVNNDLSQKQSQLAQILNNELPAVSNKIVDHDEIFRRHESKIAEFDEKIKNFNKESLEILGRHFFDNYKKQIKAMIAWLAVSASLFLVAIIIDSIYVPTGLKDLYVFVPRNLFFISLIYFAVAQYSQYKKLAMDYKNREVVAKSYLGILSNSQGEERNTITAIVADTLFSRNTIDQGADLPVKEAMRIGERMLDAGASIAKKNG